MTNAINRLPTLAKFQIDIGKRLLTTGIILAAASISSPSLARASAAGASPPATAEPASEQYNAPALPPVGFRCDGDPPVAFTITFYQTHPAMLVAERRGQRIIMTQQVTASGILYKGIDSEYAEHQGEARIVWPGQPMPLRCTSH